MSSPGETRWPTHDDLEDIPDPEQLPLQRFLRPLRNIFGGETKDAVFTNEKSVARIADFPLEKFQLLNQHLNELRAKGVRIIEYHPVVVGRYTNDKLVTISVAELLKGHSPAEVMSNPDLIPPEKRQKLVDDALHWLVAIGEYLLEKAEVGDVYMWDMGLDQLHIDEAAMNVNSPDSWLVTVDIDPIFQVSRAERPRGYLAPAWYDFETASIGRIEDFADALDIDINSHPLWRKAKQINDTLQRL
jgi:hypothetical protein